MLACILGLVQHDVKQHGAEQPSAEQPGVKQQGWAEWVTASQNTASLVELSATRKWGMTLEAGFRTVLDVFLPPVCAACGTPGMAVCARCLEVFSRPFPVSRSLVPVPAYSLARYQTVARKLVLSYKERGRRDLAEPLGALLAEVLVQLPQLSHTPVGRTSDDRTLWLVPVPSRRSSSRLRGGPHIQRLAKHCAKAMAASGQPAAVAPALKLGAGVLDSTGLSAQERKRNLADRVFLVDQGAPPAGASVVLLDDVITTGATVAACTRVLAQAGYQVAAVMALTATG